MEMSNIMDENCCNPNNFAMTSAVVVPNTTHNAGLTYGDMPMSYLTSKFEETPMEENPDVLDNYVRGQMTDWGPDTPAFEHEAPRGGVNRSYGRLQLQYYGHRGNEDTPYRPEYFDGFAGPEDADPRGTRVDPDMRLMRGQLEDRTRFVRWSPDMSDHITGGSRSEGRMMADQQQLYRTVRDKFVQFDRQMDGRRNGMTRTYENRPVLEKYDKTWTPMGDYLRNGALTPQMRKPLLQREKAAQVQKYRAETMDTDFAFARYSQLAKGSRNRTTANAVAAAVHEEAKYGNYDGLTVPKMYKSMGLLMSQLTEAAKLRELDGDGYYDYAPDDHGKYKGATPSRDLNQILYNIAQEGDFSQSDTTPATKMAKVRLLDHAARQVTGDASDPIYFNAETIYKGLREGGDVGRVKSMVITDGARPESAELAAAHGRTARQRVGLTGARLPSTLQNEFDASMSTYSYHGLRRTNGDKSMRLVNGEDIVLKESDNTQGRTNNHTEWRASNANDTVEDMRYDDNASADRHTGGLGSKYTMGFIDRDSRADDIAAMS